MKYMLLGFVMAQAVSRRPLTEEARLLSQASPREISSGQSGTMTCSPPGYFGFPPFSIISPMLHTHLRVHIVLTMRTIFRSLGNFQKHCSFGNRRALRRKVLPNLLALQASCAIAQAGSRQPFILGNLVKPNDCPPETFAAQSSSGTRFSLSSWVSPFRIIPPLLHNNKNNNNNNNHGSTALYGLGPPLSEVTRSLCICGSERPAHCRCRASTRP
jgi:hypothetical protein